MGEAESFPNFLCWAGCRQLSWNNDYVQVWSLYNTDCMDFHLFFCCANVKRLAALLPEEERASVRPLWQVR